MLTMLIKCYNNYILLIKCYNNYILLMQNISCTICIMRRIPFKIRQQIRSHSPLLNPVIKICPRMGIVFEWQRHRLYRLNSFMSYIKH